MCANINQISMYDNCLRVVKMNSGGGCMLLKIAIEFIKKINQKFKLEISITYLYYIIKYKLNITYKQLRTKYYPLKKLPTLKKDKYEYYKELKKVGKDNIISIDETGFYLNMKKSNARCQKGSRCYDTTYTYLPEKLLINFSELQKINISLFSWESFCKI